MDTQDAERREYLVDHAYSILEGRGIDVTKGGKGKGKKGKGKDKGEK